MKPELRYTSSAGMTLAEVILVITVVFILAVILLPAIHRPHTKAPRIACVNNLKQIGLALRMWANENDGKFPWEVADSSTKPGSMEFTDRGQTWHHFWVISNELSSPKVLKCYADTARERTTDWNQFTSDKYLSYFVGLDADEPRLQTILSGDRNLAINGKPVSGLVRLTTATPMEWTKEIHQKQGNVCLGDGSVRQVTIAAMNKQIEAAIASETNRTTIRLLIP